MSITNFAVEGLVLNDEGQAILIKRGPMFRDNIGLLEGIGGQCNNAGRFRDALHREIEEEVGTAAVIEIDRFSHVRLQHEGEGASGAGANWIVVSYICW
ncbi:NUDIX domain-containing protein [Agrobacterium sp. 22-226-1]